MKLKRYLAAAAAVLAIGVTVALALSYRPPAPGVAYTLLDGSRHHSDALRGRVVLVNFWATSCAVCVREMPALAATHDKFVTRGYETLAVAMRHDPPAYVVNFAQARRLPFGVVLDHDGAIARAFGDVRATPTHVLIDRRGRIVQRVVGEPDFAELHALIDKLLAES